MSKNLQPTIDYLTRGADDYLARMEASKAEAQQAETILLRA